MPPIKLFFLQASRCIRTAWLLEELGLDYEVEFAPRVNNAAPAEFKKAAGGLGKFPTLIDRDVTLYESGNIAEYLCDVYDKSHRLLAKPGDRRRYEQLLWVHASEGTYLLHALAITYVRWNQKSGSVEETEAGLSKNVQKDLDHFEAELKKTPGKFLLGDELTIADISMHFSLSFILARKLGTQDRTWPAVEQYVKDCKATEGYQKAQKKTGLVTAPLNATHLFCKSFFLNNRSSIAIMTTQSPEFQTAVEESRKLKAKPSDNELLELYGLFKQGTQDPPFEQSKAPGMFELKEKAKRNAWQKIVDEGVTPEEAQTKYIALVNSLKDKYGYSG